MSIEQLNCGHTLYNGRTSYVIESVLGKGGFGITYKGYSYSYDKNGDSVRQYFAIKEFFVEDWCERKEHTGYVVSTNPTREKFDNGKRDFLSEAKRLSQVSHANIVKVYDVFEENNTVYYVMEYIDGSNLNDYISSHNVLDEAHSLKILQPIFDAVKVLHQNNITHLDIKPANIMLSNEASGQPTAKLIDFGLAKHYDNKGNPTTTLRLSGCSDGYSPTEQYGGISTFSPQSDVYALGATLFHCVTGHRPPKSTETTVEHLAKLLPSSLSVNTQQAILGAMKMNKLSRTQSVDELVALLYDTNRTRRVSVDVATIPEHPLDVPTKSHNETQLPRPTKDKQQSGIVSKLIMTIIILVILILSGWIGYSYMQKIDNEKRIEKLRNDSIENERALYAAREQARQEALAKARQDSIDKARQDSIDKARQDSIDKARQDSIKRVNRVTPDLAFFNLHGPVKTLKDEDGKTWEFTPEGNLKTTPSNFTRDSKGYIVMETVDSEEWHFFNEKRYFRYNDKMQIYHIDLDGYEGGGKIDYTYDSRGLVVRDHTEYEYDELTIYKAKYTYTNIDKYGNWTTRNWIVYDTSDGEEASFENSLYDGTEYRTITYYE